MAVSANARTSVPVFEPDDVQHRIRLSNWAIQAAQGKLNNTGSVTLSAGVASTSVSDARVGINSFIGFTPTTANAASETGAGTMFLSTRGDGFFVITHANNATADRTFAYCILG